MSRPDYVYWGSVPTSATPAEIIAVVRTHFGPDDQQLAVDAPGKNGFWFAPHDWNSWGDISLTFSAGKVHYNFTGQWTWSFHDDDFEPFIEDLAKLATGAWESREGDEDDQDEDVMVWRGPNPRAIAEAKVEAAREALRQAGVNLMKAQEELSKVT